MLTIGGGVGVGSALGQGGGGLHDLAEFVNVAAPTTMDELGVVSNLDAITGGVAN